MPILLAIVSIASLIWLANLLVSTQNETYYQYFDWLLLAINLPLFLLGLLFIIIPAQELARFQREAGLPFENMWGVGVSLLAMAAWGLLVSLGSTRRTLAQWLPLNPGSPVHALALVLSGYLAGNTLLTLTQGGLVDLAETAVPATLADIFLQFLAFVLVAVFGVGLLTRRHVEAVRLRLGLERPTRQQLIVGTRWIFLLVALQWIIGAIGTYLNPEQIELLDDVSGSLLADFDTIWEWLLLALASGVGEELLFRGALQPILGLKFTAVIFAIAHVQYGITPITLAVFVIGIALGYIRRHSSTTIAIFVHVGYNFILGMLALLATYLQQFVS